MGLAWLAGLFAGLLRDVPGALAGAGGLAALGALAARSGSPLRLTGVALAAALLGAWRASLAVPGLTEGPLTAFRGQVVTLRGVVAEPPRCGAASCLFVLRVQALESGPLVEHPGGLVQVRTSPAVELQYGRTATARGELRAPRPTAGFPQVELLARGGIHEVMEHPLLRFGPAVELPPRGRLEALRAALEQRLVASVQGPEGQLAAGLLLGRDATLGPELRSQLQVTGTSHILAVSGFNVALVGGAALGLAVRLVSRPWALPLSGGVVFLYTLLVGAPPSAVRAALMFSAVGMATMAGRLPDPLTSLVLAAALMGAVDPPVIRDLGFQLSFGATAGLVLFGGRLTPTWRRLPRPLATGLGLTLAAELFTLPLVLHTFHTVSLVAPLANVLVAPVLPPLMGCAVLGLVAAWLPGLGPLVAGPAWLLGHYVLAVIGWAAGLPSARLATGSLPSWGLLVAYACILAPLGLEHLGGRLTPLKGAAWGRSGLAAGLLGLAAVALLAGARTGPSDQLRVRFFDSAGDGLSLLETPSGRRALLGSAGSPLAAAALAEQLPLLDRAIDLLVVTRAGERDLDGLAEIARRYPIALVVQPSTGRGESWSRWTGLLAERSIPIVAASPGLAVELGDGARLEVDNLAEADADRAPNLSLRLLFGSLDLRLVGGTPRAPFDDELTAVVRLAPELGLTRELRRQLPPASDRAAVVGGRGPALSEPGPLQFRLSGGDVVELSSDGAETSLRRAGCQEASGPCSWP